MLREELTNYIEEMTVNAQYAIFCEYCEKMGYYDDRPEYTSSIDDYCMGMKPSEIIEKYGSLDLSWDYYYIDGYGDIEEWDGIETNSSVEDIVDFIIDEDDDLNDVFIRDLLDEYSEEEEEED